MNSLAYWRNLRGLDGIKTPSVTDKALAAQRGDTNAAVAPLSVRGLCKRFGAVVAVDDVDFELHPGEALGIIGPNGAGKSTLFDLVAGSLVPEHGTVTLHGHDVTQAPVARRCRAGLARTFQIPRPFGRLSVFENLLVAACAGRQLPERAVVDDCAVILDRTGLLAHANRDAAALTLLERKRLELARALAGAPDVLLLDEIAGGLTTGECDALVETIRTVHASGTAIVWTEHVLHALSAVVSRLLVLDFGRVVANGPPAAILSRADVRNIYLGLEA